MKINSKAYYYVDFQLKYVVMCSGPCNVAKQKYSIYNHVTCQVMVQNILLPLPDH